MFGNSLMGVLKVFTTSTPTTGTIEETLASYAMPANLLNRNGQRLFIRAWGTTAANGNNKTQRLMLGSTQLVTTGALAANDKDWQLNAIVIRTGQASATSTALGSANAAGVAHDVVASTEDFSTALTIALKATDASSAADTTLKGFTVEAALEA
jgi:hypothetical protein